MKLVILHGPPAVGKLTVARELAALSGWKLFHNHLVVDALLEVFEFGSPGFVTLRERMWLDVFAEASASGLPGLIFTFNPESSVAQEFLQKLADGCRQRGDSLHFVALTCPEETIEQRLDDQARGGRKLRSLAMYRELRDAGVFKKPVMPPSEFTLDTSLHDPAAAARTLWQHFTGGRS